MSGYKWDPVFRVVPRNGGESVYWLTDNLTDVKSHTKITLRYVESKNIREDINRSLRPVVYGLRPEVEIECVILSMADQQFLAGIESALLLPNHYNVYFSLDGGCVEREVVLSEVSNLDPIRGKTVIGSTFKIAVRCVDLIPRKPTMMADPRNGVEKLLNGGFESWGTAVTANGWNILNQAQLPSAVPFLQLLLSHNGLIGIAAGFVVHEHMDVVLFREAVVCVMLVLVHASIQVVGHTDVKRAVSLTGHNVDEILVH